MNPSDFIEATMKAAMDRLLFGGTFTNQKTDPKDTVFTIDKLRAAVANLPKMPEPVRIFYTISATEDTDERLFPYSRHRSRRVEKKLIKRHGGVFKRKPAMFKVKNDFYAHPSFRSRIEERMGPDPRP